MNSEMGRRYKLCVGGRDTGGRRVRKAWGWLGRCTDALAELEKQGSSFPGPWRVVPHLSGLKSHGDVSAPRRPLGQALPSPRQNLRPVLTRISWPTAGSRGPPQPWAVWLSGSQSQVRNCCLGNPWVGVAPAAFAGGRPAENVPGEQFVPVLTLLHLRLSNLGIIMPRAAAPVGF